MSGVPATARGDWRSTAWVTRAAKRTRSVLEVAPFVADATSAEITQIKVRM